MLEVNNALVSSFAGLHQLLEVYEELDSRISEYKKTAGIDCIKYCKRCCGTQAKNIEVSVFEILPLAIHLWQRGEADLWLAKLSQTSDESPCVLYNPDPTLESGCRAYVWRPLICRLFGFSAVLNKEGKPSPSLCRDLKAADPGLAQRVQELIKNGLAVPVNSHFARKISAINPFLGQVRYSINNALRLALETAGFRLALLSGGDHYDDIPPRGPQIGKTA